MQGYICMVVKTRATHPRQSTTSPHRHHPHPDPYTLPTPGRMYGPSLGGGRSGGGWCGAGARVTCFPTTTPTHTTLPWFILRIHGPSKPPSPLPSIRPRGLIAPQISNLAQSLWVTSDLLIMSSAVDRFSLRLVWYSTGTSSHSTLN